MTQSDGRAKLIVVGWFGERKGRETMFNKFIMFCSAITVVFMVYAWGASAPTYREGVTVVVGR